MVDGKEQTRAFKVLPEAVVQGPDARASVHGAVGEERKEFEAVAAMRRFEEPVADMPENLQRIPAPADMHLRSPQAVEDILGPHVPDTRKGFFGYGRVDQEPDAYPRLSRKELPTWNLRRTLRHQCSRILPWLAETASVQEAGEIDEGTVRQAYRKWPLEQHNIDVPEEWMVFCRSTLYALESSLKIDNANRPERTAAITPIFNYLQSVSENATGALPLQLALRETDQGWKFDIDAFKAGLDGADPKVTTLILCNPNNPTGYVFRPTELDAIVTYCNDHEIRILSDEVWADTVHQPGLRHTSILESAKRLNYEKSVRVIYGPGKGFNISGFPCSILIIPNKRDREDYQKAHTHEKWDRPSKLAAQATVACFTHGAAHLEQVRRFIRMGVEKSAEALRKGGCKVHVPESTYLLFPDCGGRHDEISDSLKAAGIDNKNNGDEFAGPGHIRITAAVPHKIIEERYEQWLNPEPQGMAPGASGSLSDGVEK